MTYAFADGDTSSQFASLYRGIRNIALPFGVIGVAGSGIQVLVGDENTAAKAKHRIIVILMATIAMFLIPTIMTAAKSLFSGFVWEPGSI